MKYIDVGQAIELAEERGVSISRPTVISWAKKFRLGHLLGGSYGKWVIDREKFERFIDGKADERKTPSRANQG